jgi:hypothetical protein
MNTTSKKPMILTCCGMSICEGCDATLPTRTCPLCRQSMPMKLVPNRALMSTMAQ